MKMNWATFLDALSLWALFLVVAALFVALFRGVAVSDQAEAVLLPPTTITVRGRWLEPSSSEAYRYINTEEIGAFRVALDAFSQMRVGQVYCVTRHKVGYLQNDMVDNIAKGACKNER
jgi:hypothetical protein